MVEMQTIIKKYGKEYKEKHKIMPHIQKAMVAIEKCRTGELGGHEEICDECGYKKISYNSCRNRHCPKCQSIAREKWIQNREKDLEDENEIEEVVEDTIRIIYNSKTK